MRNLILIGAEGDFASFHKGGLIAAKGNVGADAGMVDFSKSPSPLRCTSRRRSPFPPSDKMSSERVHGEGSRVGVPEELANSLGFCGGVTLHS